MDKRQFLKTSSCASMGILAMPSLLNAQKEEVLENQKYPFSLPPLPFALEALEPYIDKMTMEIHHSKHHAIYVQKLNEALQNRTEQRMALGELMATISTSDTMIRNHGGGHYNHSFFWKTLNPKGLQVPNKELLSHLETYFGSFEKWKEQFSQAAKSVFGSGWVWLIVGEDKKLTITTTANQDNPLMRNIVQQIGVPIIGLDVWEHAYYLKYQNLRADYIQSFYQIINWREVEKRYKEAILKK